MELIEVMDKIREEKIGDIKDNTLYPSMMWFSNYWKNTKYCNFINKHFFFVNPKILLGLLSLTVDKNRKFIKYPKSKQEKDKKMEVIKPYLKKIYGWGEREFQFQVHLINLDDLTFIHEINKKVGFSKQECKILGIKLKNFKVEKPKDNKTMSLFQFN